MPAPGRLGENSGTMKSWNLKTLKPSLRTRLAPTPSGLLHPGNGLSFVMTWCLARAAGGQVLLRIDDLDISRRRREYMEDIFRTLDWLGLDYDEGPAGVDDFLKHYSQHTRLDLYWEAIERLRQDGHLYACTCSRKEVRERSADGHYPLTCRNRGLPFDRENSAWRIVVPADIAIELSEWGQTNPILIQPAATMGDFVVRQKNGWPAYQIASLIDDLYFHVNFIVRGEDLQPSTAAQLFLSDLLAEEQFQQITFWHHPLLTGKDGEKLSKSKRAASLQTWQEAGRSPLAIYQMVAAWLALPEDESYTLDTLVEACRYQLSTH